MKTMRFWMASIVLTGVVFGGSGATAQEAAPARECRETVYKTADGRQGAMRFCKDEGGVWRRVEGVDAPPPPLPLDATITFSGTYSATITRPGPPIRRFDLRSVLRAAGTSQTLEGTITFVATLAGQSMTARVSGTGGVVALSLSGSARGGLCQLTDSRQTVVYEGKCGQNGFSGTIKSMSGARNPFSGRFETKVASIEGR